MPKVVFTPVYRRKAQGEKPRVGLPDSIRPGDYLTVFINGAAHTRRCMSAHKGYVLTEPLRWNGSTLDSSRKIPWEDIDDALRPPEGYEEPLVDTMMPRPQPKPPEVPRPPKSPEPLKKVEPTKAKPEPPKKQPPPPKPAPPPLPNDLSDLWSLLSDK